jgi:hypothetical protein
MSDVGCQEKTKELVSHRGHRGHREDGGFCSEKEKHFFRANLQPFGQEIGDSVAE